MYRAVETRVGEVETGVTESVRLVAREELQHESLSARARDRKDLSYANTKSWLLLLF